MSVSFIAILLVTGFINVKGQRYDPCSELRSCEQKLDNLISSSSRLPSYQCREVVQNINCMIKSINCVREEERHDYGSKIRRAREQHKSSCDSDEWSKKNACFDSSEVSRCENNFPRRAIIHNRENCRTYDQFHDCMTNAVNSRSCRGDDGEHIFLYLLDMANDLPWQCPQYSSSPYSPTSSPSWPYGGRGPYNNSSGTFNEEICCRSERCDNNRLRQCQNDLRQSVESRDSYSRDSEAQCRSYLNRFNCFLWHSYRCANRHEKNTELLRRAKESIESKCDVRGDIQKTQCFSSIDIRDCEKYLGSRRSTSRELDCGEYKQFYDCAERYVQRSCNRNDELFFGFYLISKVNDKAWSCSYFDSYQTQYPYDTSQNYPVDDTSCEAIARQNYRDCERRMEESEEEVRKITSSHDRHTRSCCSALNYRECVRQVVRKHCQRENSAVIELLMGSSIRYRIQSCDDINYSTCSGARTLSNILFMAIALIFSRIYFQ